MFPEILYTANGPLPLTFRCSVALREMSDLPDPRPAVTIAERFHPTAGPTKDGIDREQLRSGMTPQQIFEAMGEKRIHWLTAIEEETWLAGELAAYPATPDAITSLRDQRQLRWERIAARIYDDATRVQDVRRLYDQKHGPDASARSYRPRPPIPRHGDTVKRRQKKRTRIPQTTQTLRRHQPCLNRSRSGHQPLRPKGKRGAVIIGRRARRNARTRLVLSAR